MTAEEYAQAQKQRPIPPTKPRPAAPASNITEKPWGVPGEDHQLWVVPIMAGEQQNPAEKMRDTPGKYKIQLLLSRPGYPFTQEREHKFIDDIVGDSHIVVAKPKEQRSLQDFDQVLLQATGHGKQVKFRGIPNAKGYLGKLVVDEIEATGFDDAQATAYAALAPFLSAWSLHLWSCAE